MVVEFVMGILVHVLYREIKKIGIAFDYNTFVEKEIIEKSVYPSYTVDVGLPNGYRQAVEHYIISKLISMERFPWCDIVFNQFMYCSVGSSINIYTTIIGIMLSIINDNLQEKIVNYNEKNFIRKYIQEK